MSDDKKIEFSQSDVLNALLHQRGFEGNREQHYATQESVDNVKESLFRFEHQTEKRFEAIDKRFDSIDKRFDRIELQMNKLLFLIIGLFVAGFSTLYFK